MNLQDVTIKKISVVTPCYNEAENVRNCYESVKHVFEGLQGYDFEHIFTDNGSTDNTVERLRELAGKDKRIKVILNSRNFGPLPSSFNALLNSTGDATVVMLAADLQDPPELIRDFIEKWEDGYEIVYGIREKREGSIILSLVKKIYYRVVERLSFIPIPPDVGEYQLIDKVVVKALRNYEDYYPYIRGMIANCGFNSIGIPYIWKERKKGYSKANLYHLIDTAINGLVSFSNVPLRLCIIIGFFLSMLSIIYTVVQLFVNIIFFRQFVLPGIASLLVAVFFFSGIQLFFLGVLGEYINAIHFQVRKRPLVIERERINFDIDDKEVSNDTDKETKCKQPNSRQESATTAQDSASRKGEPYR